MNRWLWKSYMLLEKQLASKSDNLNLVILATGHHHNMNKIHSDQLIIT